MHNVLGDSPLAVFASASMKQTKESALYEEPLRKRHVHTSLVNRSFDPDPLEEEFHQLDKQLSPPWKTSKRTKRTRPLHLVAQEWIQERVLAVLILLAVTGALTVGILFGSHEYSLMIQMPALLLFTLTPKLDWDVFCGHRPIFSTAFMVYLLGNAISNVFISPYFWVQVLNSYVMIIHVHRNVVPEPSGRGEIVRGGAFSFSQAWILAMFVHNFAWFLTLLLEAKEHIHDWTEVELAKFFSESAVFFFTSCGIIRILIMQSTHGTSLLLPLRRSCHFFVFGNSFSYLLRGFIETPDERQNVDFFRWLGVSVVALQIIVLLFQKDLTRILTGVFSYGARRQIALLLKPQYLHADQLSPKSYLQQGNMAFTCTPSRRICTHNLTMIQERAVLGSVDYFVVMAGCHISVARHQRVFEEIIKAFQLKHDRGPTFWIATDETDYSLLPIFAAGCKQALVFTSDSLLRTPEGILQLYTALSIHTDLVQAPIGGYLSVDSQMLKFHVRNLDINGILAKQLDHGVPSAEVLKHVVATVGIETFMGMVDQVLLIPCISTVLPTTSFSKIGIITLMENSNPTSSELDLALLEALDGLGECDHLISKLIDMGANPAKRREGTFKLPHFELLTRSNPDIRSLDKLFSVHFEIDSQIGQAISTNTKQLRVFESMMKRMCRLHWRADDGSTVLHRIVDSCRSDHITDTIATQLGKVALNIDPKLLFAVDARFKTPGDLARLCRGATELERLLTVVVFGSYQLAFPEVRLYKSATALVMDCRDLTDGTGDDRRTVIKLMTNELSWQREIESRHALRNCKGCFIEILSAATTQKVSSINAGNLSIRYITIKSKHTLANELMERYPYALLLAKADRNLLEIVSHERLAAEPIHVIRNTVYKIAVAVAELHQSGVVHGDIKPRNVVRTDAGYRLIDFDMSFALSQSGNYIQPKSAFTSLGGSINPIKVRATSLYASPEFQQWAATAHTLDACSAFTDEDGRRIDIWALGMLLYAVTCGNTMLDGVYDIASPNMLLRLSRWDGIRQDEIDQIKLQHPDDSELTSLIDLLSWILASKVSKRPRSIDDVLNHAFFEPNGGALMEHFVLDQIMNNLKENTLRPCVRVMISYSWGDSEFVLNRLALELGHIVEDLWLDRLGGDRGMQEWTMESMRYGVENADVVIAVVSPSYVLSKNCGYELEVAATYNKKVVPVLHGFPIQNWPPAKVGESQLTTQFSSNKLTYVDLSSPEEFHMKFEKDLKPYLLKEGYSAGPNHVPGSLAQFQVEGNADVQKILSLHDGDVSDLGL